MERDALVKRLNAIAWRIHCTHNRVHDLAQNLELLVLQLENAALEQREIARLLRAAAPEYFVELAADASPADVVARYYAARNEAAPVVTKRAAKKAGAK